MPILNDIIKVTFVQEQAGVQMQNDLYWQIVDLGDYPSVTDGLNDIITAYHAKVSPILANNCELVCAIYENQTTTEIRQTIFTSLFGVGGAAGHPQDQVLHVNRYAPEGAPVSKVHRCALKQSGTIEALSTRGRINNLTNVTPFVVFLTTQQIMPGPSWTLNPQLRVQVTPPPAATYAFHRIDFGQESTRFFKLGGRKTALCSTS